MMDYETEICLLSKSKNKLKKEVLMELAIKHNQPDDRPNYHEC